MQKFNLLSKINCTISLKIWLGFGFILVLLQLIAATTLYNSHSTKYFIAKTVNETQPAIMKALELRFTVEHAAEQLSHYLLTKEPIYKQGVEESMASANKLLEQFSQQLKNSNNKTAIQKLSKIKEKIQRFQSYKKRMFELAESKLKNEPGFELAITKMNPLGKKLRTLAARLVYGMNQNAVGLDSPKNHIEYMALKSQIDDLRYGWANVMIQVRGYLSYRDKASKDNIYIFFKELRDKLKKLQAKSDQLPFEVAIDLETFSETLDQFQQELVKMIEIHGSDKWRTDAYLLRNEVGPLNTEIEQLLQQVASMQLDNMSQTNNALITRVTKNNWEVIVVDSLMIIVSLVVAWLISMTIRNRLKTVVNAMNEVAQGDGNLSRRLDESGNDEMSQLAISFNKFVQKIKGVVDLVIESSSTLAVEAQAMSSLTNKTRDGATQQKSDTQEAVDATQKMNEIVSEVSENAKTASEAANTASIKAHTGKQIVDEAISRIQVLSANVDNAREVIQMLSLESENIDEVVTVIKEIADQTNLLALNAAIEAARAGDQGRGFAIVADEVRNLAVRTQIGTEDIQKRIEQLKSRADQAMNVMLQSSEQALHSTNQAAQAGESLEEITQAVNSITTMNKRIDSAIQNQQLVVSGIHDKIGQINQIADQTAMDAVSTSASSNELSMMAAQLKGLVKQFLVQDKKAMNAIHSDVNEHTSEKANEDDNTTLF